MTDLRSSYAWCRDICRKSRSSFFSSFALLDAPRREAMFALYAFSRISDDLSDEDEPPDVRARNLSDWRTRLENLHAQPGGTPEALQRYTALWPALSHTVQQFKIPMELLCDIVDGVTMDLSHRQARDWSELDHYCYHVASAVGLACTHIWHDPKRGTVPRQAAIDCGIAFQLTNILRDVAEDATMGRIYLPLMVFEQHRVTPSRWLAREPDGEWDTLIATVADRAVGLYENGWETIESLSPRSQRMFSLMWRSYRSLLQEIVVNRHRLWTGEKIRLSTGRKLTLLTTHFVTPLYSRLPTPCPTS